MLSLSYLRILYAKLLLALNLTNQIVVATTEHSKTVWLREYWIVKIAFVCRVYTFFYCSNAVCWVWNNFAVDISAFAPHLENQFKIKNIFEELFCEFCLLWLLKAFNISVCYNSFFSRHFICWLFSVCWRKRKRYTTPTLLSR